MGLFFPIRDETKKLFLDPSKVILLFCALIIKMAANQERTFIMIKPDGVQRGIVGEIIKRFEQKGFTLVAMKMMQASVEHLEEHYADLSKKPFFPRSCEIHGEWTSCSYGLGRPQCCE